MFNLVGLPSYPGGYDRFLIVVGLAINRGAEELVPILGETLAP